MPVMLAIVVVGTPTEEQRVKAQADEDAGRDGDRRAEAGHALHEVAETEGDDQHQDALVGGDAGQHGLDFIHGFGLQREIVGEKSGQNDNDDRPERVADAFQGGCPHMEDRHPPEGNGRDRGDEERDEAGSVAGHLENAHGDDQPDDREQSKQKFNHYGYLRKYCLAHYNIFQ